MRELTVLKTSDNKKIFSRSIVVEDSDRGRIVRIKNTPRAVRKAKKTFCGEAVLLESGQEADELFLNHTVKYETFDYRKLFPVFNKICSRAIEVHCKKIPAEDFYIAASPTLACEIIGEVYGLSKVFTVISDEDFGGSLYDALYFKYGVPIRQLPSFNKIADNSIVIRCNVGNEETLKNVPVIDMCPTPLVNAKNCIDIRKIRINDRQTESFSRIWGGNLGICFYEFLDIAPEADAEINLHKGANGIFLLDTGAF